MQSNVILCPFAPPTIEDSALRVNVFVPSDNQGSFRALAAALPITSTVATLLATLNDATAANVTAEATHRLTAISAIANVVGSDAPAAFLGDDFALADLYSVCPSNSKIKQKPKTHTHTLHSSPHRQRTSP